MYNKRSTYLKLVSSEIISYDFFVFIELCLTKKKFAIITNARIFGEKTALKKLNIIIITINCN